MSNKTANTIVGIFVGASALTIAVGVAEVRDWYIPQTKKVQESYVAPSKLENECKDISKTDCVKIDGTPYLLKYDENNRPVLLLYKIKPAEVVPLHEEKKPAEAYPTE